MLELFKTMLSRGGAAIGALLFHIAVIRLLPVAQAGQLFLWLTTLYVASFIGGLGLDTYLLKRIAASQVTMAAAKKRFAFLFSAIVAIGVIGCAEGAARWILMALPFFVLVSINSRIMRAKGAYMAAGFFEVSVISAATFGLLLVDMALGVDVALNDVVGLFIAASIILCVLGEYQLEEKFRSLCGWARYPIRVEKSSLPFMVFPFLIFLTQWMPLYFLTGVGDEAISVFNIAVRFASLITFFSISIDSYLAPKFSALHATGGYAQIQELVAMFRGYSLLACVVFFVLYFLCGEPLMTWWGGDVYAHAYYVAVPVLMMYFFMLIGGPYQSFLLMSDQEALVNRVNVLALMLVFGFCAISLYLDVLNALTAACALLFGRGVAAAVMMKKGAQFLKQQLVLH